MSEKTKANASDSSHGKSSMSELKSLGSTSSITIPKSSPVKKIVIAAVALLAIGGGGFVFSTSDMGKSLINPSAGDEDVAKDESDTPAATPDKEGLTPDASSEAAKNASLPPQGPTPPAAPTQPVAEPVKAAVAAPAAPAKKAAIVKNSKSKKGKAVVSKKHKKHKAVAKSKAKKGAKAKALAAKKAKAKTAAQASVAPAQQ